MPTPLSVLKARAIAAVRGSLSRFETQHRRYRGWLKSVDGSVSVSGRPGYVYVQRRDTAGAQTEEIRMPDTNVPSIDGYPVVVGHTSVYRNEDVVIGRDTDTEESWLYDYVMQAHASQHAQAGFDTLWVQGRVIMPMRVCAQSTPNLTVNIEPGVYPTLTGNTWYDGATDYSMSAYIPDSGQRWVIIGINQSTDLIQCVTGTPIPRSRTLVWSDLPAIPSELVTLAAIIMYAGQSAIADEEIFELRAFAGWAGTLAVQEDGVEVLDTATALNFTGDGVSVSIDGTVATILITGGGTSIEVRDDGVLIVDGVTVLSFTGDGVSVAADGTTAVITINAVAAASLSVQDDGVLVVDGATILNFTGDGVEVTADGLTATIYIPYVPDISGNETVTGQWTFANDIILDDGVGDSPAIEFVGGQGDTARIYLVDDIPGNSDLAIQLCAADADSQLLILDNALATVASIDAAGNALFVGHVGIGASAAVKAGRLLEVLDTAVDTDSGHYGGFFRFVKTAGATDGGDLMTGLYGRVDIDQSGGTVGTTRGFWGFTKQDDGTIDGNMIGLQFTVDANADTVTGDAIALFVDVDQEVPHTVDGDVVGLKVQVDCDGTVTGTSYAIQIFDRVNVDFCIYQSGVQPNYLRGITSIGGPTAPLAQLHVDQPGASTSIPAVIVDQGDESEQHIVISMDGSDKDFPAILQLDVTGTPTLSWIEATDEFGWNKNWLLSDGDLRLSGAAKAVRGVGDSVPTLGTTTETEKWGHVYPALTKDVYFDGETNASAGFGARLINRRGIGTYDHHARAAWGVTATIVPTGCYNAQHASYNGPFRGTFMSMYPGHATLPTFWPITVADPIGDNSYLEGRFLVTGGCEVGIRADNYDGDRVYANLDRVYAFDTYLYATTGSATYGVYTRYAWVQYDGAAWGAWTYVNVSTAAIVGITGEAAVIRMLVNLATGTSRCIGYVVGESGAATSLGFADLFDDGFSTQYQARRLGIFARLQGSPYANWDWYDAF